MNLRTSIVFLVGCTGQASLTLDSATDDAAMCTYDVAYYCDYRPMEVFATCSEYSQQAFDYLDGQSQENSSRTMEETCTNNGATWGEGTCPRDDTWVGACVGEVGGTIGLVYSTHYYSEPELILPDGTSLLYDDTTASAVCAESTGFEWCNDGAAAQ